MAEPTADQAEDAQPPPAEETPPDGDEAAASDPAAPTATLGESAADDAMSAPSAPSFAAFKMSSRRRVVLAPSSAAVAADARDAGDEPAAQTVTALEDRKLQGADGATLDKKAGPLVIPMLATNDWRVARAKASAATDKSGAEPENVNQPQGGVGVANGQQQGDLTQQAKAELLREARGEQPEEHEAVVSAIPMLMRNRVPDGYESDEKFDVSLRPDESALSDYDSVPITDFGLAMLRGMGWNDGAPIGRTNKRVVAPKVPELRPKGLGLGADKALAAQANGARKAGAGGDKKQEQLRMVPGANVMLTSGKKAGMYGRVDSLDEDNSRAVVTLAIGGAAVSCSQFNLLLVDKETYDKFAKCINVDKYAEYTMKRVREQEAANGSVASSDNSDAGGGPRHKKRKKEKRRPPSVEPIDSPSTSTRVWPRRDMRVRVVDSASKRFRDKVRVVDAASADCCTCRADDGTVIVVPQHHLETVVPRGQDAPVLVFKPATGGSKSSRGCGARLGRLLEADRRACVATVQYATGSRRCDTVDFDHLCEFVGNADEYDD